MEPKRIDFSKGYGLLIIYLLIALTIVSIVIPLYYLQGALTGFVISFDNQEVFDEGQYENMIYSGSSLVLNGTSGQYTSKVIETNNSVLWTSFSWNENLCDNSSIEFKVRVCDDSICENDEFILMEENPYLINTSGKYLQYKVEMASELCSPSVSNIEADYLVSETNETEQTLQGEVKILSPLNNTTTDKSSVNISVNVSSFNNSYSVKIYGDGTLKTTLDNQTDGKISYVWSSLSEAPHNILVLLVSNNVNVSSDRVNFIVDLPAPVVTTTPTTTTPKTTTTSSSGGGGGGSSTTTTTSTSVPTVSASTITVDYSRIQEGYNREIVKDSVIKFKYKETDESISLISFDSEATFSITGTPNAVSLTSGKSAKINLDDDSSYDVELKIEGFKGNGVVEISLKEINEEIVIETNKTEGVVSNVSVEPTEKLSLIGRVIDPIQNAKPSILASVLAMIIVSGVYLVYQRHRNKSSSVKSTETATSSPATTEISVPKDELPSFDLSPK